MAIPNNPTATVIATEALNRANEPNPGSPRLTRAKDVWLEEVKNEIWLAGYASGNTRLKTLQTFDIQISVLGQSKYDFPSDFDEEMSVEILDGTHADTATAGGNNTITCAADEDITEDSAKGKYILLTSGTGVNGLRQCITYSTTTKQATVDANWDTNPANSTTYLFVDEFYTLEEGHINDLNDAITRTTRSRPTEFYKIHEGVNVRFIFDFPPDKSTYGIRVRYYANISKVDLTEGSTLISAIYLNWQSVLIQGVFTKILDDKGDQRFEKAEKTYKQKINGLLKKEIPYGGEFQGFTL